VAGRGPLVWADEFDGPAGAPPDPRTWRPETGGHGWGNAELQYYTAETANAALDGAGHLAIRARHDNRHYTSARLITKNLRSVRYGAIEASIKLPGGRGIWPAFWLLGNDIDDVGWPSCGEIDVMENFGTDPAAVHGAVHGPGYYGDTGIGGELDAGAPLAADFHAYAVHWEPDRIRWFFDGTCYHTVTPASLRGNPWVFDHDCYLLLNVAVGGTASVPPDGSTPFPQTMLVDYVCVYAP
jgi:beta-glucanase (GH16 family)